MRVSRRAKWFLVVSLVVVLGSTGVMFGPEFYRTIRYQHYDRVELPTGGTVVLWQERGEEFIRSIYTPGPDVDPDIAGIVHWCELEANDDGLPFFETVVEENRVFHILFPGAEDAEARGGTTYVEHVYPEEACDRAGVLRMIEERAKLYPGIDWEPYRSAVGERK